MSPDERAAYVALALVPGIGSSGLSVLRNRFGSWTGALDAPAAAVAALPGLREIASAVRAARRDAAVRLDREAAVQGGIMLTPFDDGFPALLQVIPDPPALLFARGHLALAARPVVAIVGSRAPSAYGRLVARRVAEGAAQAGLVIASGMARGLDAVAHAVALEAGTGSIGVLGCGLGVVYPVSHRPLYDRMSREGLLLTEHLPGQPPHKGSFPSRNRLIAGLARATVIVEAGRQSGALITARAALEQGRDILVVPGPITSPTSVGTNELLRAAGAGPWLETSDLLKSFPELPPPVNASTPGTEAASAASRLGPELARVYRSLDARPRSADELARALALEPRVVLGLLTQLELEGVAEEHGLGYVRI